MHTGGSQDYPRGLLTASGYADCDSRYPLARTIRAMKVMARYHEAAQKVLREQRRVEGDGERNRCQPCQENQGHEVRNAIAAGRICQEGLRRTFRAPGRCSGRRTNTWILEDRDTLVHRSSKVEVGRHKRTAQTPQGVRQRKWRTRQSSQWRKRLDKTGPQ